MVRAALLVTALCAGFVFPAPRQALGQGIATGSIRGTVRLEDESPADGAQVRIVNTTTGLTVHRQVRHGRFLVQGLETGGPYVVELRHLGFAPQRSAPLVLRLGESLDVAFVMRPLVQGLDTLLVRGTRGHGNGGSLTLISDSLVHRLPALNRNAYDFVALAPHVSTKVGFQRSGVSGAGANLRFNNFLINGADERFVNGNVPAGNNDGKSIPLDAVKEYQVLVAPYDVRYGDFAGALVNTVTQSGTNDPHGSLFAYWRNDRLRRTGSLASGQPYEQIQYGLTFGGPIVHDRIHFFIAPEIQRLSESAPGPYVGQPSTRRPLVPVSANDIDSLREIMDRRYGLESGSAGLVTVQSPLQNLFARMDATIPEWNSRVIAFVSDARAESEQFTRTPPDTFYLSTQKSAAATRLRLTSLQLHTDLPRGGGHNELQLSHVMDRQDQVVPVRQPIVRVMVPGTTGNLVMVSTGTANMSQGRYGRSHSMTIRDDLSLPVGANHLVLIGAQAQRFRIERGGVPNAYGTWTFPNLAALEAGTAERYELRKDFDGATAPLRGGQYAAYLGDHWRAAARLQVTLGVRADFMTFASHAPYNRTVDSLFGRRTDEMPRPRVHLSPRLGFTWDLPDEPGGRLRGGIGVFTGRPPRAWLAPAVTSYGTGVGVLSCGNRPTDADRPPVFVPDYRATPTSCASGPPLEAKPFGEVYLLDRDLRMAQSLRASLAHDRRLPWETTATFEAVVSRYRSDFMFVNLNLTGPMGSDRSGRVMYGTVDASGVSRPAFRSGFSEVMDLRNTSRNYSAQLSARAERHFTRGTAALVSYTWSHTRDVQSPSRVNTTGVTIWADALATSGRHEAPSTGVSLNDIPHRAVAALTWTAPWDRWATGLSFYYIGESGGPFTYLAWGTLRRGDLNADGSNANDPIYVPRNASASSEIRFSGVSDSLDADNSEPAQGARIAAQQAAFDGFIARSACLTRQRGGFVGRNSCREPWSHTTIASVRQALPIGGRGLEAELDVFNVLNLLNGAWGQHRVASARLLEHVGQAGESLETSQPVFRFDVTRRQWTTLETASAFQLQLALRYRF